MKKALNDGQLAPVKTTYKKVRRIDTINGKLQLFNFKKIILKKYRKKIKTIEICKPEITNR